MASVKLSTKAVGSIVKLKVDGTLRDFIVVHQGKPSSLYDASCDGTWLLLKDCLEQKRWHSANTNDYKNSEIHSYLNNTWLNKLDANIRAQVKQVKLPYVNGTANSAVASGANGLSCKIFLLSGYEVGFTQSDNSYFPVDGARLAYFENGTGTSALIRCITPPLSMSAPRAFWALIILSVSSSNSGKKRRAMVIIMANSCTGTPILARGLKSRSMASVSCVGEVVNVRTELASIRVIMRIDTNRLFNSPFFVIFMNPHCQSGSPVP